MSKHTRDLVSDFELEGRFLGFLAKDGHKIKYLRLSTATGVHTIKLSKDLRRSILPRMAVGEWLSVSGQQKRDFHTGISKLKADRLLPTAPRSSVQLPQATPAHHNTACILVCQKSDCCKRGGQTIAAALEAELSNRSIAGEITVKSTGCMKRCKTGPNIVMPDKTRYAQIHPADVPAILDKHFPQRQPVFDAAPAVSVG